MQNKLVPIVRLKSPIRPKGIVPRAATESNESAATAHPGKNRHARRTRGLGFLAIVWTDDIAEPLQRLAELERAIYLSTDLDLHV